MRRPLLLSITLLLALTASAAERTEILLARAWPAAPYAAIEEIGNGVGVIFTPDLSVQDNCRFFEAMGFACFESADWLEILAQITDYNFAHPTRPIRTLIVETHGTNGHGLKVQTGKKPDDPRSYISVAALQEMLDPIGVRYIILSACNSGRLLRPEIYRRLNRDPGDKLFLPATRGIVDATDFFDPKKSNITVITPATSHIETTLVGALRELKPSTREALEAAAAQRGIALPEQFAVSEMLIQMLLRAPELQLRTGAHVEELSKVQTTPEASERLFRAFVTHLDFIAARADRTAAASTAAAR
ncbi:MAG TPA: hypothetical protein VEK11_17300 [Thermoanaerobaculia bacterium]|jgi:hypothetical protein|nr:hypothetical protein [Thermoanaerobaculia bacterium]